MLPAARPDLSPIRRANGAVLTVLIVRDRPGRNPLSGPHRPVPGAARPSVALFADLRPIAVPG